MKLQFEFVQTAMKEWPARTWNGPPEMCVRISFRSPDWILGSFWITVHQWLVLKSVLEKGAEVETSAQINIRETKKFQEWCEENGI